MTSANEFDKCPTLRAEAYHRKCQAMQNRARRKFNRTVRRIFGASVILFLWAASLAWVATQAAQ